ncbi:MAG: MraY family glycosyltransferase, partial [Bacteroidota bacterium]
MAIVAAFLLGLVCLSVFKLLFPEALEDVSLPSWATILCGVGIAGMGFYDDIKGLSFKTKFLFQIAISTLFVATTGLLSEISLPLGFGIVSIPEWIVLPVALLWLVFVINAFNLLDGMDGLASGVALIALASLSACYLAMGVLTDLPVVVTLAGAVIGFLRYNFNPAKVFMGDTGSMFLGFMLGSYALTGATRAPSLL